jgi:hypothetical protein
MYCPPRKLTESIASFVQNPLNGGIPIRESPAKSIDAEVSLIVFANPPISSMKRDSVTCNTHPAARKSEALNTAWLRR